MSTMPQLDGARHSFVHAGALRMHVAELGPEDRDPLLLVHGFPQHWWEWRYVMPELARDHRVLAVDLRGLGWTDAPRSGYMKEEMALDIVHLLDAMGIERVNLVGHDWGGYIGFLLAILHPERVRRYIALNMIHPWLRFTSAEILHAYRLSYQLPMMIPGLNRLVIGRPGFMRRFLTFGSRHREAWTEEDVEIFSERLREPARVRASARIYRAFNSRELFPMLRGRYRKLRLTAPTLLLFGTRDAIMRPAQLRGFEPFADEMRLELVPDAGHFIAEERPDIVVERARELFGGSS